MKRQKLTCYAADLFDAATATTPTQAPATPVATPSIGSDPTPATMQLTEIACDLRKGTTTETVKTIDKATGETLAQTPPRPVQRPTPRHRAQKAPIAPAPVTPPTTPAAPSEPSAAPSRAPDDIDARAGRFRAYLLEIRDNLRQCLASVRVVSCNDLRGRVVVDPFGASIPRENVHSYHVAINTFANAERELRHRDPVAAFYANLQDQELDERAALLALNLRFHDDRGDGLVYVPAFHVRAVYKAYQEACSAAGVAASVVRPCLH